MHACISVVMIPSNNKRLLLLSFTHCPFPLCLLNLYHACSHQQLFVCNVSMLLASVKKSHHVYSYALTWITAKRIGGQNTTGLLTIQDFGQTIGPRSFPSHAYQCSFPREDKFLSFRPSRTAAYQLRYQPYTTLYVAGISNGSLRSLPVSSPDTDRSVYK